MNNDKSFVKLNRKITQWEWFQDGNVLKVWIFILVNCNWETRKWKGEVIEKGSFITSVDKIGSACGLTSKTTRNILDKLEKSKVIERKRTNKFSVIKALKWDFYQDNEDEKGKQSNQQSNHQSIQQDNQQSNHNKEYKEVKEVKNNNIYVQEFETLWKLYPKKQGKHKAMNSYQKSRKNYTFEEIESGLNNYIFYIKENKMEYQFIKNGSTWFHQECWNDDYSVYKNKNENSVGKIERIMNL